MKYVSWSQKDMSAVLRDQNRNYYNWIVLPTRSMTVIEPRFTIKDTIEFEATPRNVELELDSLKTKEGRGHTHQGPC
jgi:hypothetical protein